jgi:hypothetical protein
MWYYDDTVLVRMYNDETGVVVGSGTTGALTSPFLEF